MSFTYINTNVGCCPEVVSPCAFLQANRLLLAVKETLSKSLASTWKRSSAPKTQGTRGSLRDHPTNQEMCVPTYGTPLPGQKGRPGPTFNKSVLGECFAHRKGKWLAVYVNWKRYCVCRCCVTVSFKFTTVPLDVCPSPYTKEEMKAKRAKVLCSKLHSCHSTKHKLRLTSSLA